MGSRGRMLFDLNELPTEAEEEEAAVVVSQPQKTLPVPTAGPSLFPQQEVTQSQGILNNNAFKHAPSGSGFQPFVRSKDSQITKEPIKAEDNLNASVASTSMLTNHSSDGVAKMIGSSNQVSQAVEREEGEWSDADVASDTAGSSVSNKEELAGTATTQVKRDSQESEPTAVKSGNMIKDEAAAEPSDTEMMDVPKDPVVRGPTGLESTKNLENKGNQLGDDSDLSNKSKDVRGVEANYALKFASNPSKRPKLDEHKEAMLGKKRARQTVFINVEDAKQAGTMKTSTPRRQSSFPAPIVTRTVKEAFRSGGGIAERAAERQSQPTIRDQRQSEMLGSERSNSADPIDQISESNGDAETGSQGRPKKMNAEEAPADGYQQPMPRQLKGRQISSQRSVVTGQNTVDQKPVNKRSLVSKKQTPANNMQYQDTSVERLIREVTSDKFWHNPEEAELQCVPKSFESAEEYIRVFEPLLFEECRAQLYSSYEESLESVSRDAHVMVRVKTVERRERGWYDVVVLPMHEYKWTFKEGEVAVLSFPRPGSASQSSRSNRRNVGSNEDTESECGRLVGTVRRHTPIDTRDPIGAIIHFYLGDSFDSSSETNVLRKLQPRSTWYLTSLGSLATTQREYVALHAFRRLNVQMQNAILQPSPEHFPKYEEQPPAMPDCFTPNFADHLHRTFNGPQLSAIHWAAMHTAAGTSNGAVKKQEPWPFTLVQGPPGTGKTHTVWGMLNVIHLVQYQHYYAALLKKLAPESYKQVSGNTSNSSETVAAGSIDEVLQSMDQNLFRTLPKLCPKPRMLVCAPSNAATDELLARVLDRGFIDGEMKVYRPDVARVGVDSQSRAAQAVSVERRTDQLLMKGRDEVIGWLQQLKCREQQLSQEIALLQRELTMVAAAGRSQGSVGVDPDVLAQRDRSRDFLLQKLAASVESRDKVLVEMSRLLILESRFRVGSNFNMEDARASLEASFANEAEIVFTTVSSSGRKLFSRLSHGFDMVVIDEAAQASEVAVLPPLSLGAARCVLVGDPQQLPATVISKAAGTLMYSRSLFERFQLSGCPTILLSVQYRMHPQIREFPSRHFYQGRLTDSESVVKLPDEAYYRDALMAPYIFYDISHGRESHRGGSSSYQNVHEAQFVLRLYENLQKFLRANGGKKASVGIITPYKLQLKCLQREFEEVMSTEDGKDIYINTVDAFQGQERDVIIMSCVRASNHGVGFVADIRRMNVALTRARRALWVVGNAGALMQSEDWALLIADAKARKCFMDLDTIPKDFLAMKISNTPGRNTSNNIRNMRTGGPRLRHLEMLPDSRVSMRPDEDERSNSVPRNGSYRNLDDLGRPGDRSRDNLPFGMPRRPNSSNGSRREPWTVLDGQGDVYSEDMHLALPVDGMVMGRMVMGRCWYSQHQTIDYETKPLVTMGCKPQIYMHGHFHFENMPGEKQLSLALEQAWSISEFLLFGRMLVLSSIFASSLDAGFYGCHLRSQGLWCLLVNAVVIQVDARTDRTAMLAHPLFMVIGLVICTGEAIMAYRIMLGSREVKKAVHLLLHLVALAFAAVGLYAAFKFHHDLRAPDIRSLHAWLGITTAALYALQWLVGFVYFVFPGAVMTMRADYAPWHILLGIVIFLMAICTAETGLARFIFPFHGYPSEAFVVNFTGLAILMFGVAVVVAVILPSRY
uniref:Cytochrome b561 domain-containing protein n=1 Tax=Oryza rufipogon TaxID=4529 RepID=A0A0E0QVR9_ORYRU